jgi:hypothetical protein
MMFAAALTDEARLPRHRYYRPTLSGARSADLAVTELPVERAQIAGQHLLA